MQDDKNIENIKLDEDFEAIKKVLDGNKSAFEFLQKKYIRTIQALIKRMIKDEDDVEDLVQETFIKAYRSLSSFRFGFSFSSWLYRIASNGCIDFLRKRRFDTISINQSFTNDDDEEQEFQIKDVTYQPDINVILRERKEALEKAINQLPGNYREIIRLRHEEELDYNQIAEKMNIPLGTVKAHLFRARKILFTSLNKEKFLMIF